MVENINLLIANVPNLSAEFINIFCLLMSSNEVSFAEVIHSSIIRFLLIWISSALYECDMFCVLREVVFRSYCMQRLSLSPAPRLGICYDIWLQCIRYKTQKRNLVLNFSRINFRKKFLYGSFRFGSSTF